MYALREKERNSHKAADARERESSFYALLDILRTEPPDGGGFMVPILPFGLPWCPVKGEGGRTTPLL